MGYCPGQALTLNQVEQLAYNAGFRGTALDTIVTISYRETGGTFNPNCVNTTPVYLNGIANYATGILQFLEPLHPVNALNAQDAFDYAFQLYQSNGFGAWTCDTECGYPPGMGVTPTSPSTVIGQNGQPVVVPDLGPPSIGPIPNPISGVNPSNPVSGLTPKGLSDAIGQGIGNGFSYFVNGIIKNLGSTIKFDLESVGIFLLGSTAIVAGILVLSFPTLQTKVNNQINSALTPSNTSGKTYASGPTTEEASTEGGLEEAAVAA